MSTTDPTNDDVWLVVPLFNEETVIGDVVRDARRTFPNVVVVETLLRMFAPTHLAP